MTLDKEVRVECAKCNWKGDRRRLKRPCPKCGHEYPMRTTFGPGQDPALQRRRSSTSPWRTHPACGNKASQSKFFAKRKPTRGTT